LYFLSNYYHYDVDYCESQMKK